MKFQANSRRRAAEYEKSLIEYWKANDTFAKSVAKNPESNAYVFYDGPPFITGVPHHGTLLSSIIKDAVPRYQTMKGKRVERVWGWDCHGLPAENFVEKQLGITDRRQIVTDENAPAPRDKDGNELPTITLEKYIQIARESMTENSETWRPVIDRIGRWVDMGNAYRTMDKNFMESVWWAFAKLYESGKIYEGEKVLMYDTKFATPVSKNEVTMDNDAYQTVTDPSVFVKFKLAPESIGEKTRELGLPVYFLAWTTTPWTLPGNTALAVNPEMNYSEIRIGDEILIVAKDLRDKVFTGIDEYEIVHDVISGAKLVGKSYEPIFAKNDDKNFAKVWAADYVTAENGTGIVHLAPTYGEEDFELAKANDISRVHVLDDDGFYFDDVSQILTENFAKAFGENYREILRKADVKMSRPAGAPDDSSENYEVFSVNKMIAKALEKNGVVWKTEMIRHEYPFNPRSKQRIMYRAIPSWFFDVQGSKPLLISQNENINWFPPHLKHGRFAKNIEQAPDWNLSRDRFWATAMPVWKSPSGKVKVVGSYAELKELSGVELDDYHRPWVDDITFEHEGETYTRIDKVLDCWFESGSMPFAQLHYPFENTAKFEANYPADFIVEYIGQVRAWFYYVHVVNTALAECGAFGEASQTDNSDKILCEIEDRGFLKHEMTEDRHAVRGIVIDENNQVAILHSQSHNFYELPGGGVENSENDERAVIREIREEAGCTVEIVERMGSVIAMLTSGDAKNISQGFLCKAVKKSASDFANDEIDEDFETIWVRDLDEAIELISRNSKNNYPAMRDVAFLKEAKKTISQKHMNAYKNVITTGVVAGNDGRKMSKSLGNFTDPTELMDEYSADSLRFLLLSSPLLNGEDFSLKDKDVGDVARKLSMIWNMYDFFTMYASVDGWEFDGEIVDPSQTLRNPLDKWIVSRLHELIAEVGENMDAYDLAAATKPILPFIDDASNWFVRRSRRRFWKSEDDGDKNDAYKTLHYVLVQLAHVIAPFTPFLAEELYQKLTGGESVHLRNWPLAGEIDAKLIEEMAQVRELINGGLSQRAAEKVKVRQPLAKFLIVGENVDAMRNYADVFAEELNVKSVEFAKADGDFVGELDFEITPELQREGMMREVIRFVQNARKTAGLNVDDRIKLLLNTDDTDLLQAICENEKTIANETLAVEIVDKMIDEMYETVAKIDGAELKVALIVAT